MININDDDSEFIKNTKSLIIIWLPWFIFPLAAIYAADFARLLLDFIQIGLGCIVLSHAVAIFAGIYLAVMQPGYESHILNLRLTKFLPSLTWSYDLVSWLIEEEDNDGS